MELKKDVEIPNIVKRCPKCNSLSLTYNEGKIKCSKCGYEVDIKVK